ncbi:MAG: AAA family ATPase [Desulfobulbaceae bacterium]|nr:AAA family ATPase [Desulfobulbaceae bacterium]
MDSSLYLDHFQLQQAPFPLEPDPEIFFQGAGHPAVLQSLLQDIRDGKPLVKLTGNEGVGKTLLKIIVTRTLSADHYDIISLDHPIGSFEDLVRTVCLALDPEKKDNSPPRQLIREFQELLHGKRERRILLIIDEAEKVFMATLERLMKLICNLGEDPVLQVLLIGRPELDHNLDQLRIYCSNVDIQAGYVLAPLNREETEKYLQFRLLAAGIPGNKHLELFSDAALSALYESAGGNITLTNMLAEKGLKNGCSRGMFRIEPELFAFPHPDKKRGGSLFYRGYDLLLRHPWWTAAAVLPLIILFFVILPDKEEIKPPATEKPFTKEDMIIEKPQLPVPKEKNPSPGDWQAGKGAGSPGEVGKNIAPAEPAQPRKNEDFGRQRKPEPLPAETEDAPAAAGKVGATSSASGPGQKGEASGETSRQPEPTAESEPAEKQPVIVQAEGRKKKGSDVPAGTRQQDAPPAADAEALFQERLRASSNWLAWSYRGGYTIQLMMLNAEDAEENLKDILIQEKYTSVRDNMYIIRRNSPPAFFVYYGMYNTLNEARQARDNLPVVLQGHQPYALSIQEAWKKTER